MNRPAGDDYQSRTFAYHRVMDQDSSLAARHRVVVVGAGPVGLTAAIDLAQNGVPVLLLDDDDRLSTGSRAICFAKRSLEIFDRLGVGERMTRKGVTWNTGKVFLRDTPLYGFDLQPESGYRRPAFINLQQYYVEGFLLDRASELSNLEIRWKNKVAGVSQEPDGAVLEIETPDGGYRLACDWLIAADGARSPVRRFMGLDTKGRGFRDRFLIADIRMKADFPAERWFWFDPPFHPNQSVLLHQQPDDIWRIDFQLGWEADPAVERQPERVLPRVRALLGPGAKFELEWVSVYSFACLRMRKFRHGRILFAGDSAHSVSPFGARGANGGIQDADNLAWKLRSVLAGEAPESLLDTYDSERIPAADENIRNSTRSTDFITPKNAASRAFRDAALQLSRTCSFARKLVNSGRLSIPATYEDSSLNTRDSDTFECLAVPGGPAPDAPIRVNGADTWFLQALGSGFTLLVQAGPEGLLDGDRRQLAKLRDTLPRLAALVVTNSGPIADHLKILAARYDLKAGTAYLFRPDQHVCARWRRLDSGCVIAAAARALGKH